MPTIPRELPEIYTKPKPKNRRKRKTYRDRTPEYKRAKAARKRANRLERGGTSPEVARAKVKLIRFGGLTIPEGPLCNAPL